MRTVGVAVTEVCWGRQHGGTGLGGSLSVGPVAVLRCCTPAVTPARPRHTGPVDRVELATLLQRNGSDRAREAVDHLVTGAEFLVWSDHNRVSADRLWNVWQWREQCLLEQGIVKPGLAEAVRALDAAGDVPICLGAIYPADSRRSLTLFLAGDLGSCVACT